MLAMKYGGLDTAPPKHSVKEALQALASLPLTDIIWWRRMLRLTGLTKTQLKEQVPRPAYREPHCKARVLQSGDFDSCDAPSVRSALCQEHLDARVTSLCTRRQELERELDAIDHELKTLSPFTTTKP